MKRVAILLELMFVVCGCAPYTQVQMRLVEQARKGVALCGESAAGREPMVQWLHELQRARLDEAFDADVAERPALTAEWVREHRKAYAVAIETLSLQKQRLNEAAAVERRNLKAIDAALARLEWLQSIQLKWNLWKESGDGQQ
jgi:hypothetical protein